MQFAISYEDAISRIRKNDKSWQELNVTGFANHVIPSDADCGPLEVRDKLAVNGGFFVEDDILDIASSTVHPLIDYSGRSSKSFQSTVHETWSRMSGSSVWLEQHSVYMTITRVFFYDGGVKAWPRISFLRAQIHDKDWKALDNYTMQWQGETFMFPRIFDVPTPYEVGGGFYGPEDPRIVIERGVDDAEPIIIFNMVVDKKSSRRGMFLIRPFSNVTVEMEITGQEARNSEKNWSPFFMPATGPTRGKRYPSKYVYFVYEYHPLNILKCHAMAGKCEYFFQQTINGPYADKHKHKDTHGVMRGGTNLEMLPYQRRAGLTTFVGIPRTHTEFHCTVARKVNGYRPEIMLMTTNGTAFWFDYFSEALDFGSVMLKDPPRNEICDANRILISNSIARIEPRKDLMTVSFSVNDETVQVARIKGVQALADRLPQFQPGVFKAGDAQWAVNVTTDVVICSIQTATDYTESSAKAFYHMTKAEEDAWREEQKKKKEKELEEEKAMKEKTFPKEKEMEKEKEAIPKVGPEDGKADIKPDTKPEETASKPMDVDEEENEDEDELMD